MGALRSLSLIDLTDFITYDFSRFTYLPFF
jgi:hypothetical protein